MRPLIASALVPLLLPLTACQNDPPPRTVVVQAQDWTGWSRQQPAPSAPVEILAVEGERAQVPEAGAIRVMEVDDDSVVISTGAGMSPVNPGGGIDLTAAQHRFIVRAGTATRFATPSMDAGTTFTVRLRDGRGGRR